MAQRMQATLHAIKKLRQRMHEPVNAVGAWLKRVVSGYYRYIVLLRRHLSCFGFRNERLRTTLETVSSGRPWNSTCRSQ
jgi:RNA-directed DNA polymerase